MGRLELVLLGPPQVSHSGRALAFRTRKTQALLIYLAVEGGTPSREKLTALFWPESDERHGRMMLRRTLAFLRQTLGEDGATGQRSQTRQHLVVERDALGLDFTPELELDLQRLAQALKQLPRATAAELGLLEAAARLYRGDFLDGFSAGDAPEFDNWVGIQREYWRQRILLLFDRLTRLQIETGDGAAATGDLRRWLALDPLNENAYQRLMQVHFAAGDRSAALEAYAACRAILASELGVEPSPETQALAERLRGATAPRRLPRAQAGLARPAVLADGPLVGRGVEFGRLIAAFHAARAGRPQFVSLEGEAGIGKTRLAAEFTSWAAADGATVLTGRAFEAGGRLPYQPVVEAMRMGLAVPGALPASLGEVWLAELAQLLPEVRQGQARGPWPSKDEAAAQARLFEAVARWGAALAGLAPLVLFVDDVQWADVASLDLLHYVGRRWAETCPPLLLLFSLRSENLAPSGPAALPLVDWLAGMQRDLSLARLGLSPIGLDDTQQYVQALAGGAAAQPGLEVFGQWLFSETRGQPFFIVETLKALLEQHVLSLSPTSGGELELDFSAALDDRSALQDLVPAGVRDLIRGRLGRLLPDAFSLLAAAAVLGHDFNFERLCAVAGLGEDAGLAAWDQLLKSGLLAERGQALPRPTATRRYRIAHDKIRDVTYTEAGEARRRIFHRRALETLRGEGAPAAELAHHALAAGETQAVWRYSLAAGDDAMRVFAVRDAISHYEAARRAAAMTDEPQPLRRLFGQLGRAYEAAGQFEQARALYAETLALARATHDPQMECVALNRLATLAGLYSFEAADVNVFLQQALAVAESSGDSLGLAETEWNLAHYAFYAGESQQARAHADRALALAQQVGEQELIARCLNVLSYIHLGVSDWAAAEAYAEQAQKMYSALGDRAAEADCLCQVANARLKCGRLAEGSAAARAARAINLEFENAWGLASSDVQLTYALLEGGDYSEALSIGREGAATARKLGMNALLIFALAGLGAVQRTLFDLEAAHTTHLEAQAINAGFPSEPFAELVATELCADRALAGDWEQAHSYAQQALAGRGRMQVPFSGLTRWLEIEALVRSGQMQAARDDVQRFATAFGDSPRFRLAWLRALAVLDIGPIELPGETVATQAGPARMPQPGVQAAITHLREAAALAEQMGLPGEIWQISARLGELHRTAGESELAVRAFARAAEVIRDLAARIDDEGLRAKFLAAGPVRHVLEQALC